jgi:hypothetical protein
MQQVEIQSARKEIQTISQASLVLFSDLKKLERDLKLAIEVAESIKKQDNPKSLPYEQTLKDFSEKYEKEWPHIMQTVDTTIHLLQAKEKNDNAERVRQMRGGGRI